MKVFIIAFVTVLTIISMAQNVVANNSKFIVIFLFLKIKKILFHVQKYSKVKNLIIFLSTI